MRCSRGLHQGIDALESTNLVRDFVFAVAVFTHNREPVRLHASLRAPRAWTRSKTSLLAVPLLYRLEPALELPLFVLE